jgi:Protein of unknown function (DUF2971)
MANQNPPLLTLEQFELNAKLESIFMPHASKQRNATYTRQVEPAVAREKAVLRFAHYTSAEAALGIIKTKRIWMRNAMCMADYREVQHGFDIFNRFFSDPTMRDRFIAAMDASAQGAALEAIRVFNEQWNSIRFDTYVTSVSEHDRSEDSHGRLSMWRAFGGSAARVAIVFKVPWFSGVSGLLNMLFSPVAYLTEDQVQQLLGEVVENVGANREFLKNCGHPVVVGWIFTMLLAGVTCLKHDGFHEEKEWRAIYSPRRRPSTLMGHSTEVIGSVPQLVCKIPLDAAVSPDLSDLEFSQIFDRLIIGPSQYSWPMLEAFSEALSASGVPNAAEKVRISGIPIRT